MNTKKNKHQAKHTNDLISSEKELYADAKNKLLLFLTSLNRSYDLDAFERTCAEFCENVSPSSTELYIQLVDYFYLNHFSYDIDILNVVIKDKYLEELLQRISSSEKPPLYKALLRFKYYI